MRSLDECSWWVQYSLTHRQFCPSTFKPRDGLPPARIPPTVRHASPSFGLDRSSQDDGSVMMDILSHHRMSGSFSLDVGPGSLYITRD